MIKRYETFKQPVYIMADHHGALDIFQSTLKAHDAINHCVIILAGDVGLGGRSDVHHQEDYENLNNFLLERHIKCYMVRGNHDDPSYFNEEKINFTNVKAVPDYSVITVGDDHILCVGGGISIDRRYRIAEYEGRLNLVREYHPYFTEEELRTVCVPSYWENEMPVFDEEKLNEINDLGLNISYVVSHTAPKFCFKNDKDGIARWIEQDPTLNEDLDIERETMTLIYNKLKEDNHLLLKWVYGHFHAHNAEFIDNTCFITLCNLDWTFDAVQLKIDEDLF